MSCVVSIFSFPKARIGMDERNCAGTGLLAGTGVIVAHDLILTCAHVANIAFGRKEDEPVPPPAGVKLQIRFAGSPDQVRSATIDPSPDAWSAPHATRAKGADLCLLKLTDTLPEGASVARLHELEADTKAFDVRASGYPPDFNRPKARPTLDIAEARVLGHDSPLWIVRADFGSRLRRGWLNRRRNAGLIYRGFSGGPIEAGGAVVGIVVEARKNIEDATAYAIPVLFFPARIKRHTTLGNPDSTKVFEIKRDVQMLLKNGDWHQAEGLVDVGLKIIPDDPFLLYQKAICFRGRRKFREYVALHGALLDLESTPPIDKSRMALNQCEALLLMEEFDEFQTVFTRNHDVMPLKFGDASELYLMTLFYALTINDAKLLTTLRDFARKFRFEPKRNWMDGCGFTEAVEKVSALNNSNILRHFLLGISVIQGATSCQNALAALRTS